MWYTHSATRPEFWYLELFRELKILLIKLVNTTFQYFATVSFRNSFIEKKFLLKPN